DQRAVLSRTKERLLDALLHVDGEESQRGVDRAVLRDRNRRRGFDVDDRRVRRGLVAAREDLRVGVLQVLLELLAVGGSGDGGGVGGGGGEGGEWRARRAGDRIQRDCCQKQNVPHRSLPLPLAPVRPCRFSD